MNINWRSVFKSYVDYVGYYEGVDFLYEKDWTPEAWVEIQKIRQEIEDEYNEN